MWILNIRSQVLERNDGSPVPGVGNIAGSELPGGLGSDLRGHELGPSARGPAADFGGFLGQRTGGGKVYTLVAL